jgi:hypothetical protein
LARSRWLALPYAVFGALAALDGLVGSHPHDFAVAGAMFLHGAFLWKAPTSIATRPHFPGARKQLSQLFMIVGWGSIVVGGLASFILDLRIIEQAAGFWGLVTAFFLGPVTFLAAPWYAGFHWGYWFPLILGYGSGIGGSALVGIGSALSKE